MDKKPHYRQTGVVFLAIGVVFLLNSVEMLFLTGWMHYIVIVITVATIIYAIGSSIVLERKKKDKKA